MNRPRLVLLLAVAALAGGIVMSLEMAAVRLFAPHFGYSIYVWGTTICVVMAAMVGGYAAGGRLANGPRAEALLFRALLAGAAWQLLALWAMPAVLPRLAAAGEVAGVALAALILFAPSMVALAATGPILVRLCADVAGIGRAAGLVYALSTAGSLGGILGTIFVLLPRVGTHATLQILCGVVPRDRRRSRAGVRRHAARGPPGLAPATAASVLLVTAPGLGLVPGDASGRRSRPTTSCAWSSAAGSGCWSSTIPRPIHSVRDGRGVWTGFYYDYFALGPLLVPARRALVLGMGAGEQHPVDAGHRSVDRGRRGGDRSARRGGRRRAGSTWMPPSDPRLRVHVMDGRRFLARDRGTYDLVQLDVFQGGPYVPFHLVTEECFRLARARMSDDALLMMNVFDRSRGLGAADRASPPRCAACFPRSWSAGRTPGTSCSSRSRGPFRGASRAAGRRCCGSNAGLRDFVIREVRGARRRRRSSPTTSPPSRR